MLEEFNKIVENAGNFVLVGSGAYLLSQKNTLAQGAGIGLLGLGALNYLDISQLWTTESPSPSPVPLSSSLSSSETEQKLNSFLANLQAAYTPSPDRSIAATVISGVGQAALGPWAGILPSAEALYATFPESGAIVADASLWSARNAVNLATGGMSENFFRIFDLFGSV